MCDYPLFMNSIIGCPMHNKLQMTNKLKSNKNKDNSLYYF